MIVEIILLDIQQFQGGTEFDALAYIVVGDRQKFVRIQEGRATETDARGRRNFQPRHPTRKKRLGT